MDMKNYIEQAEKKAGSQTNLAKILDITDRYIRQVKNGKQGFAVEICIQLADYIGADRLEVIAASNLVTEKDKKKRKILESCFSRAATLTTAALLLGITSIMTPSQANASPVTAPVSTQFVLCKIERRKRGRRLNDRLNDYLDKLAIFFQRRHSLN